jgi:predicted small integral membrane protein
MTRDRLGVVLARANVRVASLLVPRANRVAWVAEWNGEIYHLQHASGGESYDSPDTNSLEFSKGAFPDALWLCRDHLHTHGIPGCQAGSAGRCILTLVALACVALFFCMILPGARRALLPLHPSQSADLVAISPAGYAGIESPGISLEEYQEWQTDTRKLFSELAWYHPTVKNVVLPHQSRARLSIGLASANFFRLLRVRISEDAPRDAGPTLLLTRSEWRTRYHSDPGIVGNSATIDGKSVRIEILREDDGRLPNTIQAWLLESPAALEQLSPRAPGFTFARIRSTAFPPPRGGVRVMVETRWGVTHVFDCVSISWLAWQPTSNFFFALLLACLALPATTALPLGDYPRYHGRMVFRITARRWSFLAVKLLLLVGVVYLATIALAQGPNWAASTSVFLQVGTAFPALLFGFRWILQDQRRRCPECLRRLSNPARVGQASCNFLSWNGTELFCVRGHGLLHIPELPTSWFSTQRWLCLDSSWRCLFQESYARSPELI